MRSYVLIAVLLLGGCAMRRAEPADPIALVGALRAGGYVIFLRHTDTAFWSRDGSPVVLEDCATQRNLSASGRAQARAIGAGFHRLLIPVGEVRASPYCRAADTARLAFDRVLIDTELAPAADAAAVRELLSTAPPPGTNTVLVGHAESVEALGEPALESGEAIVVKPLSEGGHQIIARVQASDWSTMPPPVK